MPGLPLPGFESDEHHLFDPGTGCLRTLHRVVPCGVSLGLWSGPAPGVTVAHFEPSGRNLGQKQGTQRPSSLGGIVYGLHTVFEDRNDSRNLGGFEELPDMKAEVGEA